MPAYFGDRAYLLTTIGLQGTPGQGCKRMKDKIVDMYLVKGYTKTTIARLLDISLFDVKKVLEREGID